MGAGSVQYFARPFIEAGIEVFSAWAANAVPVAEYTVAQIILANKGYFQRFHRAANSGWVNRSAAATLPETPTTRSVLSVSHDRLNGRRTAARIQA